MVLGWLIFLHHGEIVLVKLSPSVLCIAIDGATLGWVRLQVVVMLGWVNIIHACLKHDESVHELVFDACMYEDDLLYKIHAYFEEALACMHVASFSSWGTLCLAPLFIKGVHYAMWLGLGLK